MIGGNNPASARGGALAGAAVAEHHHPANRRVHRRDQQGLFHLVLTDDCGEGEACHSSRL